MIKEPKAPKEPKQLDAWQAEDAARLKALFEARAEPRISQMEFGAQFEIGSQGMVWQYLDGRRPLNISAAVAFARGLGVKVDQFSPTIAGQINAASQLIERSTGENVSYIQRINSPEAQLLEFYRLMDDDRRQKFLRSAADFPKMNLLAGARHQE